VIGRRDTQLGSPPPSVIDESGAPRFGKYLGPIGLVDLSGLRGGWRRGALYRYTHRKKWLWFMIATPQVAVASAVVDASYAANGFLIAADLEKRTLRCDRGALGVPWISVAVADRANEGADARFTWPGLNIRASRKPGTDVYVIRARVRDLSLDAELDAGGAPAPLTVVAPVTGGTVNVTQKLAQLPVRGTVRLGDRTYSLEGGFGGFDYTSGLLARHTAWRWAFATGRDADGGGVAFNLVTGINDTDAASENVVWVDGVAVPVGRVDFQFDAAATTSPWRIASDDGIVDLVFDPIGEHREDRDLGLVRSHFVQVIGTFKGTIDALGRSRRVSMLAGVTEDQDVIW
jgi:hypothetical protein